MVDCDTWRECEESCCACCYEEEEEEEVEDEVKENCFLDRICALMLTLSSCRLSPLSFSSLCRVNVPRLR